jgi:hypothetical protein
VRFSPQEVVVERTEAVGLTMDVRQFAQAVLGDPSVLDLARIGLVDVADAAALESASRLLPASPVYCPEFF